MSLRSRRLASIYLVLAVGLALIAQYYFAKREGYLGDAILLYGLASLAFLGAIRVANIDPRPVAAYGKPWWAPALEWLRAHPWRGLAIALSALTVLGIGARAAGPLSSAQGYTLLGLWGASLLLYLAAALDWVQARAWLRGVGGRLRASPWEAVFILCLFAIAAATRLTALDRYPFVLSGDEASMGQEALRVLDGLWTNPFVTGWLSHPTLFFYVLAAAIRCLGITIVGLRFVPALAGALTVPALYLMVREYFDRRVAAIAALYLACYHYAIHYSRLGLNNIVDPLLAVLTFYFLARGLRTRGTANFIWAGLALGLGQYFYMGSRAIPVVLVLYLGWVIWHEPALWRTYRWQIAALVGAFLLAGWPLFMFFVRHPQDYMARMTQLGIFQNGWLEVASQAFGRSKASLLWEQFIKSALAFHFYPDPTFWYHPGRPLLDFLSAVPFTLGLIYSTVHLRERKHALLVIWFWAVLILGGMLLENPPSSQRLVLDIIPVSVFIGLGLSLGAEVAERVYRWQRSSTWIILGLIVAGLGWMNLQFYFVTYSNSRVFGGLNTEVGNQMGFYLHWLGPDYRYYLFGPPRMYAGFPTLPYLAVGVDGEDVVDPLTGPPTFVKPDKRPVFLFLPEREGELEAVKLSYPTGRLREFRQPSGALLFVAYEPDS